MRGHRDLKIVAAAALLCAVLSLLLPIAVLSLVFAAPLAFALPGYALTAAIFARRPIEWPQLLFLSLGLSLAVLALGALVLNYLPGGVRAFSWALLLLLVVLNGCRAAALRRPKASTFKPPRWPRPRIGGATTGLLLGALAATAVALALAFTTTSATNAHGYTELWLLPPAPPNAETGGARVGVTSQEQGETAYRLQVRVGDRSEEIVRRFSLDPGETRVLRLNPILPSPPGASVPVSATLYLQEDPGDAYRRVSGWMARSEE